MSSDSSEEEELVTLRSDTDDQLELEDGLREYHSGSSGWLEKTKRLGNWLFRKALGLHVPEDDETSIEAYSALSTSSSESSLNDANGNGRAANGPEDDPDEPSKAITEEQNAGFFSMQFFSWYNGMIKLSAVRPLQLRDVPRLLPRHDPPIHGVDLEERWKLECERCTSMDSMQSAGEPSLTRTMYYAYRWEYLRAFFPRLVKVIGSFVGPWVIKLIVSYIEDRTTHSVWWALGLLVILATNLIITSIALQRYWHIAMGTSIHIKSGVTTLIYRKLLKLSAKAKQSNIAGKLTNLMSADVSRIQDTVSYLHFLWATPMMMIFCFISVCILMGAWPTIAGFGVFFVFAPISAFIAWKLEKIRAICVQLTDTRVKATNEIFSTMKTVKVYALEEHFAAKAQIARAEELRAIRRFQIWKAMHNSINFGIVPLMSMATFLCYILRGSTFTASSAFSVISLYYVLKWPFSLLTQVISSIVESRVSIRRIEEFLALPELPGMPKSDRLAVGEMEIVDGTFHWDKQSGNEADLKSINFHVAPGTLTCVIGSVGAGKSTLLNVFLGEIESVGSGYASLNGKVCYAPQTPFLLHATVRDNILFGCEYNHDKYLRTIQVCALQADFDMLIAGDLTTIGERGINLSGGQKARIAMARAIYSDSDIYLLDDPLSAVDAHVGFRLFNEAIRTMLKNKTVILVTHQLQFVTHGDQLVVMQDGSIQHQGTPQELKDKGVEVEKLLEKFNRATEEQDPSMEIDPSVQDESSSVKPLIDLDPVTAGSSSDPLRASSTSMGIPSLKTSQEIPQLHNSNGLLRSSQNGISQQLQTKAIDEAKKVADQNEAAMSKANIDQKEERGVGHIGMSVYKFYFGHRLWWWIFAVVLILAHRAIDVFLKVWIAEWANKISPTAGAPAVPPPANATNTFYDMSSTFQHSTNAAGADIWQLTSIVFSEGLDVLSWPLSSWIDSGTGSYSTSFFYSTAAETTKTDAPTSRISNATVKFLWIYVCGNLLLALMQMLKETMILLVTCSTGRVVYMTMFMRLLRAPMAFFDTTPKGRIAARCSSDTDAMDNQLGGLLTGVCDCMAQILSSLVSIAMSVHWFVLGMIPMSIAYINHYNRFINGYRELARLQGITKAPLFSQFSETLNGLYTLRAYGMQEEFVEKLYRVLDINQRVYFYGVVSARWLGVRMDILGAILISSVAGVAIFNDKADPGLMGMALSYCLLNTELLNGLIRGVSDVESRMNSVERIEQYTKIDVERPPIIQGKRPPRSWPSEGRITFKDVVLRYREGLPLVLNGLSFKIHPSEKIGIVGRTGAGKSSLLTALLSLAPLESGKIEIDGVDINEIGVDDLRSKLSIIPQDPCIFDGNVRHNIDPFGKYSDSEIWETLRRVHLADAIDAMPNKLDSELADEGANFSLGQRQLLCVGRAILRRSKILLLDEASSSIDLETDYLLQRTLRTEFADCTTITIAHRLATIMDSDRVMVLEAGTLKEFDSPANLLSNPKSLFSSLHQQAQSSASH